MEGAGFLRFHLNLFENWPLSSPAFSSLIRHDGLGCNRGGRHSVFSIAGNSAFALSQMASEARALLGDRWKLV
jgi:hypothetical protein